MFIAQIPESVVPALVQSGISGAMLVWFMWRDGQQRDQQNIRQTAQDQKLDQVFISINNLARATLLEVMSRPNVMARAKEEAERLLDAVGRK